MHEMIKPKRGKSESDMASLTTDQFPYYDHNIVKQMKINVGTPLNVAPKQLQKNALSDQHIYKD